MVSLFQSFETKIWIQNLDLRASPKMTKKCLTKSFERPENSKAVALNPKKRDCWNVSNKFTQKCQNHEVLKEIFQRSRAFRMSSDRLVRSDQETFQSVQSLSFKTFENLNTVKLCES